MATRAEVIAQLVNARNAVNDAVTVAIGYVEQTGVPPLIVNPPPVGVKVPKVVIGLRGQSNAYWWLEYGHHLEIAKEVTRRTGVSVQLIARANGSPRTILSGTGTAQWLGGMAKECATAYSAADPDPSVPFFDVALHWENDIKTPTDKAVFAQQHKQVRETIKAGVPARENGKYITLLCTCPYASGTNADMVRTVDGVYSDEIEADKDILIGIGNPLDADHIGDWSHWSEPGAGRAARLVAIRISAIIIARGWAKTDIQQANLGPYIYRVIKVGVDTVRALVRHDTGSQLVLPKDWGSNGPDVFNIQGVGNSKQVAVNGYGLDITFGGEVKVGALFTAYSYPWYYAGKMIYDDSTERMPLCRSIVPLPIQANAVVTEPTDPIPVVLPPPVVTPIPGVSSTLLAAQNFVRDLVIGDNIERGRPWTMKYDGELIQRSTAYFTYRNSLGLTHSRYFYPWRPTKDMLGEGVNAPSADQIDRLLVICKTANACGESVFLDFTDVMNGADMSKWELVAAHIELMAKRVAAANFDPKMLCVGPFNELEFDGNGDCNWHRIAAHKIIRQYLPPPFVILHGSAQWNHYSRLVMNDWALPPDDCIIAQYHCYEGADNLGHWQWVQSLVDEMSNRFGSIPVVGGEIGLDDFQHMSYSQRWLLHLDNIANAAGRSRPMLWATTDGNDLRLTRGGSDARYRKELETAVRNAAKVIKSKPDWNKV